MHGIVPSEARPDVFRSITTKIVAGIEAGADKCVMPWHGGLVPPTFPVNAATNNAYRGVNIVALWVDAMSKQYLSGYWASYKQWQSIGAQVRKGERGSTIVFYKPLDQPELAVGTEPAEDSDKVGHRFVAKASHVFNAEQVEGWHPPVPEVKSPVTINEEVAAFIAAIGADVRHGFAMARYRRDLDRIEMPSPELFTGTPTSSPVESYHAVLLHELVHHSGAPQRLDRVFGKRFGDEHYAFEELVAELGAAFLCSAFQIVNEPRSDHAAYISSWLTILGRDTKAVFSAAGLAQQAVHYLTETAAAKAAP